MAGRTAEVYQGLANDGRLSDAVKEALLDEVVGCWMLRREYPFVVAAIGDADARIARLVEAVERARKESADGQARAAFNAAMDKGGTYYEALVATGNDDAATRIANRLLKLQPANTTYVALIERALRAEKPEAARALAERAYATLTERELKLVRLTARKIPAKQ
jgi:hypothetical protein